MNNNLENSRYIALLGRIVAENTDENKTIRITPSFVDGDNSPELVQEWYQSYRESKEDSNCTFEDYINRNGYSLFSEKISALEGFILERVKETIHDEAPDLVTLFEKKNAEMSPAEILKEGGYNGAVVEYEQFLY